MILFDIEILARNPDGLREFSRHSLLYSEKLYDEYKTEMSPYMKIIINASPVNGPIINNLARF
jgi:hypothetical protein